jgi:hypothetical protein
MRLAAGHKLLGGEVSSLASAGCMRGPTLEGVHAHFLSRHFTWLEFHLTFKLTALEGHAVNDNRAAQHCKVSTLCDPEALRGANRGLLPVKHLIAAKGIRGCQAGANSALPADGLYKPAPGAVLRVCCLLDEGCIAVSCNQPLKTALYNPKQHDQPSTA